VPISTGGNSAISFVLPVAKGGEFMLCFAMLVPRRKHNPQIEEE